MRLIFIIFITTLAWPALAQQQDLLPPKTLEIIATQRNQALGDAAVWQAKAIQLKEELDKALAKIKELEEKSNDQSRDRELSR